MPPAVTISLFLLYYLRRSQRYKQVRAFFTVVVIEYPYNLLKYGVSELAICMLVPCRLKGSSFVDDMHILWITAALGCDGDTVALTAATQPSIEDLIWGNIPGVPQDQTSQPRTLL